MRTSRKLTHVLFAILALLAVSVVAMAADPGTPVGNATQGTADSTFHVAGQPVEIGNDMKAGSILAYTRYTSSSNNTSTDDTRVNITNVHPTMSVVVHFFFVNSSCSVADFKTELTQNQTYSFLTSDFDPDTRGYILAVAEDEVGVPIAWNYLIGDAFIKSAVTEQVYSVNLAAISYAARWTFNTQADETTTAGDELAAGTVFANPSTFINFGGAVGDGGSYDALGRSFAIDNIPSRAGGDRVSVISASVAGTYVTGMGSTFGVGMFGVLYDDAEQGQSFTWTFGCAEAKVLSNTVPRTAPRLDTVVPAGRTGWIRTYSTSDTGLALSMVVYNTAWVTAPQTNFHGAHNVHVLTRPVAAQVATLPVFPFELQTN